MFNFGSSVKRLLWDKTHNLEVISTPAVQQLFNSNTRAGKYVIEAPCSLGTCAENRDAILSSPGWGNSGVSPFIFEISSGRNYQTLLFPTALSLLQYTN